MDYKEINDYELVSRIRENDEDALEIIYEKYEPVIRGVAKKYYVSSDYLGVDMNDLIQEGRIALYKAINCYDQNKNTLFYTYLGICLNSHLISYCRNLNSNYNAILNSSYSDDCFISLGDYEMEPYNYVVNKDNENMIVNYKNMLDFRDSNIFELRFNGFSYKEIGQLLGISIYTVDSRLCKIRKILQGIKDKI